MGNILDELQRIVRRCERASEEFETEELNKEEHRLFKIIETLELAWSGSYLGYHAYVYKNGMQPRRPGEHFDTEWGVNGAYSNCSNGEWAEYDPREVRKLIREDAGLGEQSKIEELASKTKIEFETSKDLVLPLLEALTYQNSDEKITQTKQAIEELKSHIPADDFFRLILPKGQVFTRDSRAMQGGGFHCPPHLLVKTEFMEATSYGHSIAKLGKEIKSLIRYLQFVKQMSGKTITRTDGKVFIGHGGSPVWRDLKDFLQDRLGLTWDEFNREPTAGLSTKDRLEAMLDDASFAFLVMTGEDSVTDGKLFARQNVIHELGLFQGRHGFDRAIVLLEEGCEEFSNIVGLTQIRFPKGNIMAKTEEIRRVLEREGIT